MSVVVDTAVGQFETDKQTEVAFVICKQDVFTEAKTSISATADPTFVYSSPVWLALPRLRPRLRALAPRVSSTLHTPTAAIDAVESGQGKYAIIADEDATDRRTTTQMDGSDTESICGQAVGSYANATTSADRPYNDSNPTIESVITSERHHQRSRR